MGEGYSVSSLRAPGDTGHPNFKWFSFLQPNLECLYSVQGRTLRPTSYRLPPRAGDECVPNLSYENSLTVLRVRKAVKHFRLLASKPWFGVP
jgi:hypothetical protein